MKARLNPFFRIAPVLTLVLAQAQAATNPWVGDTDNNFLNNLNWTGDALPNFGTDIMRFDGPGSQGNSTITGVNLTMTNTGTGAGTTLAQILFQGTTPAMTLSGGTIGLGTAALNTYNNAIVLSSGSTVTQTIASNMVIDDGKAYTASVVNNSTTGGLLKFTGNITGGSGAGTPGSINFSFGNTSSHSGNYEVTGNITAGGASNIILTKRGSGILTLSGSNTLGNGNSAGLGQNEANSTIRITGGTTALNNGAANHWGGSNINTAGSNSPVVQISGGILNAQSARNLRNSLLIDGGTLNIAENRLGFDSTGTTNSPKSFTMTSGAVNFNSVAGSGSNFGVRFGSDSGSGAVGYAFSGIQSGGVFTVKGAGNQDGTFSLGSTTASVSTSYSLSGGTLDVQGTNNANGWVSIGADSSGTSTTTFTLDDSGKLISRFDPGASSGGINGRTGSAVQVLSLQGGTLVAGRIDATNLRGSAGGTNGTLVNNGTTIAAGDIGTVGKTSVIGDMNVTTGAITLDLGGLTASNLFQESANSGRFDNISITGNLLLGGTLGLNLVDGYVPNFIDIFKIIDVGGTLAGSSFFTNVNDGGTLATLGNEGTFKVYSSGNDIYLSEFTVIPEPRAALLGSLGLLALLRRRRSGD